MRKLINLLIASIFMISVLASVPVFASESGNYFGPNLTVCQGQTYDPYKSGEVPGAPRYNPQNQRLAKNGCTPCGKQLPWVMGTW